MGYKSDKHPYLPPNLSYIFKLLQNPSRGIIYTPIVGDKTIV